MASYEVVLRVETTSAEDLVKIVEVLSRTMVGLGLDGHEAAIALDSVCPGCEDCETEEPTE